MLDLTISIEKNLAITDKFTVKDGTTWGDPARGSKNLVLLIERFAKSEYIPLDSAQVTPDSTPKSVSEWVIKLNRDGYYKLLVVASDSHNQETTYNIDQVVYGSTEDHTGLFVSLDENVPAGTPLSDTYYWEPITKICDYPCNTDTGSDYIKKDHVHDLASRVCVADKALKFSGNKCDCPDKGIADDYFWSLLYHHSTIYSVAFGEYEEAGLYLDQVIDRCTNGSAEDEEDCGCNG